MTDTDRDGLRAWAREHVTVGSRQARQVLALFDEHAVMAKLIDAQAAILLALLDRCGVQADVLTTLAAKDADRVRLARKVVDLECELEGRPA